MEFNHETVLLKETIDGLNVKPDGIYVDCTLGGAGHSKYLLNLLSEKGRLIAFDQDIQAITHARESLRHEIQTGKLILIQKNFRQIEETLKAINIESVDGIYYDLGVSSPQLDVAERGFSYRQEAPLDMRMNQEQALTAYEIVNQWPYEELVKVIYRYGEEKFAKRIGRTIVTQRQISPISSTIALAEIVKMSIPAATRRTGGHPAKRTFQAIRIAVNDELGALEDSIVQAANLLKSDGRMSVITFHSLEDRFVKQYFKELASPPNIPYNLPVMPSDYQATYRLVTRKPIEPSQKELEENNRSRSAKLRIIEKI